MLLDSINIPGLYRLIHEPELGGIDKIKGDDISLSVALFLAVSRPFDKPKSGKIPIKAINHYGDEVLKVYEVQQLPQGSGF